MSQFTPPTSPGALGFKPHRGTAILVLGILSLVIACVGWIMGIIAWTMARRDLAEMDAGLMDPSGRGITSAGKICGIISVILHLIAVVVWILWMVLFAGIVAAGAAGAAGHR